MSLESTHVEPLAELAAELGVSRGQLVAEAVALFTKAVSEVRRGRRLVAVDPQRAEPEHELVTPVLSALDWTNHRVSLDFTPDEHARMLALLNTPPSPTDALLKLMREAR